MMLPSLFEEPLKFSGRHPALNRRIGLNVPDFHWLKAKPEANRFTSANASVQTTIFFAGEAVSAAAKTFHNQDQSKAEFQRL